MSLNYRQHCNTCVKEVEADQRTIEELLFKNVHLTAELWKLTGDIRLDWAYRKSIAAMLADYSDDEGAWEDYLHEWGEDL